MVHADADEYSCPEMPLLLPELFPCGTATMKYGSRCKHGMSHQVKYNSKHYWHCSSSKDAHAETGTAEAETKRGRRTLASKIISTWATMKLPREALPMRKIEFFPFVINEVSCF